MTLTPHKHKDAMIAAAPELLEILLEIKSFMGADFEDLPIANRACAAITKATNSSTKEIK